MELFIRFFDRFQSLFPNVTKNSILIVGEGENVSLKISTIIRLIHFYFLLGIHSSL